MQTGIHTLGELFGNRQLGRLVIPEAQRDYVWQKEQVGHLFASINEGFNQWQNAYREKPYTITAVAATPDTSNLASISGEFEKLYRRRTCSTNVGFIYAYSDPALPGDYFLIDGQQRLTTLFLLLAITASRDADLRQRFAQRYYPEALTPQPRASAGNPKLDYRLREYTTFFFQRFVRYILQSPDWNKKELEDQSWYLKRVQGARDTTVVNLIKNADLMNGLMATDIEVRQLFEYLEDLVEFWYFDTNESAQGEELYIYLNARGKSLATNENLKSELLKDLRPEEKQDWGIKWEEWQDYFWQQRDKGFDDKAKANPDADDGFNAFLRYVKTVVRLEGSEWEKLTALEKLQRIESGEKALRYLEDNLQPFKHKYLNNPGADWVDNWFTELWYEINKANDTTFDKNGSRGLALVCASLLCAQHGRQISGGDTEKRDQVFRAIRLFYLRYHNKSTATTDLHTMIKALIEDRWSEENAKLSTEVRAIIQFLDGIEEGQRREYEAILWEIENHPYNLDGPSVEATHVTHLIDLNTNGLAIKDLERVRDKFYALFPLSDKKTVAEEDSRIREILFYYGPYWHRKKTQRYPNYDMADWSRTIRGQGSAEGAPELGKHVFRRFFEEYIQQDGALETILANKKAAQSEESKNSDQLIDALRWYSRKMGKEMWHYGDHIALDVYKDGHDSNFCRIINIWNTRGNFHGWGDDMELSRRLQNLTHNSNSTRAK